MLNSLFCIFFAYNFLYNFVAILVLHRLLGYPLILQFDFQGLSEYLLGYVVVKRHPLHLLLMLSLSSSFSHLASGVFSLKLLKHLFLPSDLSLELSVIIQKLLVFVWIFPRGFEGCRS